MREAETLLWQRYHGDGDTHARDELITSHMGLVHHIARHISARLPAEIELDDLVSAGAIGLLMALESFDPGRSLAFSTYATPRIRGAILDDLRVRDWVPRSVRARHRRMSEASSQLNAVLGRMPKAEEMAEALELDMDTYWRWVEETDNAVMLSIHGLVRGGEHEALSLSETLADSNVVDANVVLTENEEVETLRRAIGELPVKERTVLALYFYEELNLREIAEVLMLTESRISQIRSRAMQRLRESVRVPEALT